MATYVKYTQVDAETGVPCTVEPNMAAGPADPALPNLRFGFALESEYPTKTPKYFGQCDDNFDPQTPGLLQVLTKAEYDNLKALEMTLRINRAKSLKYEQIATQRWKVESSGITVTEMDGQQLPAPVKILTAIDDQLRITSVLSQMERDKRPSVRFKAANNVWVEMSYANLAMISKTIADHVQACFDAECNHSKALAGLVTVDEVNNYDIMSGWPAN